MASLESGVTELMTISNLTSNHCSTNMATNMSTNMATNMAADMATNNLIAPTTSRGVLMNNKAEGNSETESLIEQADIMELETVEKRM